MRPNLGGLAFIGIGGVISLAIWSPIPVLVFLGVGLFATLIEEARKG